MDKVCRDNGTSSPCESSPITMLKRTTVDNRLHWAKRGLTMDRSQNSSSHSAASSTSKALTIIPQDAGALTVRTGGADTTGSREMLDMRLQELLIEISILKARLRAIKHDSGIVVRDSLRWVDTSAHDQLGAYPWMKLSAASLAAFMTGRLLRHLPLGFVAIAAKPLLFAAMRSVSRGREF